MNEKMKRVTYTFDEETIKRITWLQNNIIGGEDMNRVPASTVVRIAIQKYFEQIAGNVTCKPIN